MDLDPGRVARLGVPGRSGRSELDDLTGNFHALRVSHDDVASGRAPGDVQPQVMRVGDVEREVVVVFVATPDEHLETTQHQRPIWSSLAGHRAPPPLLACRWPR